MTRAVALCVAAGLCLLGSAARAGAQQDTARLQIDTSRAGLGWDSPRVKDLIARAAVRRAQPLADSALHNYKATAEGFLYFFLDRRETDERTLVRVNQIGLELYWKQPGIARQRIAGMRDASPLPNTMRYHIDHLTMVQNGFGNVIRVGDGDEVSDVVHPASPDAGAIYEYRLADSLEIRMISMPQPLRVYEVQVRPRRTDRPGFVGSIFIDRETADIIRMTFTFTPSSYVDKRLDYINLSLDNGLWENKYWLPNEQTVEIRRQIPELDFVAGSVIRGRMRITDYQLNTTIPDSIFRQGRAVVSASPEDLKNYKFQQGIFDDVRAEGLSQTASASDLRKEAAQLIGAKLMSGLPSTRLYFPDVSSGIRYNRAEGLFLGLGVTNSDGPPWRFDAMTGYAFGSERGSVLARVTRNSPNSAVALAGFAHQLRDMGPVTSLAGVTNSLSSMFLGKDYLDPWFATGGTLRYSMTEPRAIHFNAFAGAEVQRSALLEEGRAPFNHDAHFRDVRPIDSGTDAGVRLSMDRTTPTAGAFAWGGSLSISGSHFAPRNETIGTPASLMSGFYVKSMLVGEAVFRTESHVREARINFASSLVRVDAPSQQYFVIGGTGTLPGYKYRSFVGRSGAYASGEITQRVIYPWLGVRALAAVGETDDMLQTPATLLWPAAPSGGLKASIGAGVSLFWDLLHVDAVKGVNGGKWGLQLSFTRILDDIS